MDGDLFDNNLDEKLNQAFQYFSSYPIDYNDTGNLFDKAFNLISLDNALRSCIIGTRWKTSVLAYDLYRDYELRRLWDQLYSGNFKFDPLYHTVIYERGKERLICSLTIKDRIVQKALNTNVILPIFRKRLVYDNCASLKYRGIDFAMNRLTSHLEKAYYHYNKNFYIAKLDIKKYFDSISHNYILTITDRYIKDNKIMNCIENILLQYQKDSYIHDGLDVPFGIGLGGEIPQSFGIICLNEMDHIIKEQLKIPYFVRYMDDIILIHNDYQYLKYCVDYLTEYINTIHLKFNEKKTVIIPASEGVLFLKFHFYLGNNIRNIYIKPYKKSIKNEKTKLYKMVELYKNGYINYADDINTSYCSWKGHMLRGDSYKELELMDQIFNYLLDEEMIINVIIDRLDNNIISKRKIYRNNICNNILERINYD